MPPVLNPTSSPDPCDNAIGVEVAFARPDRQWLIAVRLPAGSTALDAVSVSGLSAEIGPIQNVELGIYGRRCEIDMPLVDGDRVEIYRPLDFDPMESRRRRVQLRG